jgi:hypothetical protein
MKEYDFIEKRSFQNLVGNVALQEETNISTDTLPREENITCASQ